MTVEEEKKQDAHVMYLVVRESLGMSPGKVAAQCGHAVMELVERKAQIDMRLMSHFPETLKTDYEDMLKVRPYNIWRENCRKVVLRANDTQWRQLKKIADVIVVDAGYTEIAPNSETILGFWPVLKSQAPEGIKKLQVY